MISQHWFRLWLGAVRQQAITWANVDLVPCRHMASPGHNELGTCMFKANTIQGSFCACAQPVRDDIVTLSLIGWAHNAHTQNNSCYHIWYAILLFKPINNWVFFFQNVFLFSYIVTVIFLTCNCIISVWIRSNTIAEMPTSNFQNAQWFWDSVRKMLNIWWNGKESSNFLLNFPDYLCLY